MRNARLEPYRQALFDLRQRLREGDLVLGDRITAKEVAERLKLSPTPVREALARLAGEGVLEERRGDGFFVPNLSAGDVSVLNRLAEWLLLMALELTSPLQHTGALPDVRPEVDPVTAVERLFLSWAAGGGNGVILEAFRKIALRLAPVRRAEAVLLDDLGAEAAALFALAGTDAHAARSAAVRAFFARRGPLADALATRMSPPRPDVERII